MSKNKVKAVLNVLEHVRRDGSGSISYEFADGSLQNQPLNPAIFTTSKGGYTPLTEIVRIFNTTMHDLGAINYKVNY